MPASTESNSWFSCLLELVGVRDMAEENPDEYVTRTSFFRTKLKQVASQPKFAAGQKSSPEMVSPLAFVAWLDKSYVVCQQPTLLVDYLRLLRKELLKPKQVVMFRAVVSEGKAFENSNSQSKRASNNLGQLQQVNFTHVAAALEGRLQHLKAIAIAVDPEVRDGLLQDAGKIEWCKSTLFSNVALTGTRSDRMERFYDVILDASDLEKKSIPEFFQILREATQRSKKAGRFFVPLLANVGRSLPESHTGSEILEELIDQLIEQNALQRLKSITNSELIYFVLLDRYYHKRSETLDAEQAEFWNAFKERFVDSFAKHSRWLKARMQKDHKDGDIPPYVLAAHARGKLTKLFSAQSEETENPLGQ